MNRAEQHQMDLREYLRIMRSRKYLIAAVTLVAVATTLFFTLRQTPIYQGEARVLVNPVQGTNGVASVSQPPNLETERELVLSQAVAQKVQQTEAPGASLEGLLAGLKVAVVADTQVLVINYSSASPATAARLTNAFANAYVNFRSGQSLDQFQAVAAAVQKRIDDIQASIATLNERIAKSKDVSLTDALQAQRDTLLAQLGVLSQRLLDLQSDASLAQAAAQVVQSAQVPTSPVSPNKLRNGILALFAGLALGLGLALLLERLDDRVKSHHEVERQLGAPVLGVVPAVGGWRRQERAHLVMRLEPKSPASESYRTLGTNIQYLASQQEHKVLLVTSSIGGEGKSTTSANLAVVLAQRGHRVVLISADLRRPRLHQFFALGNSKGLSSVLGREAELTNVAQDPGVRNLVLVSSGPIPLNPAELLGSRKAADLIGFLRQNADFVILDTPPVLAVADASILAPLADGTIFVIDAQRSSRSAISQSREQLENAGGRVVGVVYNNMDRSHSGSYPSYYYYHQYQTYESAENGDAGRERAATLTRRGRRPDASPWQPVEGFGSAGGDGPVGASNGSAVRRVQ